VRQKASALTKGQAAAADIAAALQQLLAEARADADAAAAGEQQQQQRLAVLTSPAAKGRMLQLIQVCLR
jgi:uncharacterized protein YoxC